MMKRRKGSEYRNTIPTRMAAGLFTTCGHRAIPVTSPLAPQEIVSVAHVIGFILKLEEILGCVILKLEEILGCVNMLKMLNRDPLRV